MEIIDQSRNYFIIQLYIKSDFATLISVKVSRHVRSWCPMAKSSIDDGWSFRVLVHRVSGSHKAVADQLGISDRTMRRYCRGEWPVPRPIWLAVEWLAELERRKTLDVGGLFTEHLSPHARNNRWATRLVE